MKTINVAVLAMMAILLGCNSDGSLADAKKVISRGEEYERGGEPEKANLEYIWLPSSEHILYIDLLDQNGNRVGSSEQVRYIDDNGQETDPYVKPSYLRDEYDPDITRYGNCVIFPVVLPKPDALYTNMPIWTSSKVRLLPDGPVEELKVEYRFYNYRMIIWMNSCVNPSDPEM
ncbi:MAG: hypothetical protein LBH06_09595, partial [Rikenellaceae bacterium]|nr:hypothetical protein [Rikenellaceae bacterium]